MTVRVSRWDCMPFHFEQYAIVSKCRAIFQKEKNLDIGKYYELLKAGKKEDAEKVRIASIPNKLIKFVSLQGDEKDEDKFDSVEHNQIWISNVRKMNDPYEFKGLILDEHKFEEVGYPKKIIEEYKKIFEMEDIGITSLSGNNIDYLPMWAYYTNNYNGFCIEYDVIHKIRIHEVLYEDKRVAVASLIFQYYEAIVNAIREKKKNTQAEVIVSILSQNMFIKAKTWEHEKEFRIPYPVGNKDGKNIPISDVGIKAYRIIAGINCTSDNIKRLNDISNKIGCGNVYISGLSDTLYKLEVNRYDS